MAVLRVVKKIKGVGFFFDGIRGLFLNCFVSKICVAFIILLVLVLFPLCGFLCAFPMSFQSWGKGFVHFSNTQFHRFPFDIDDLNPFLSRLFFK